MRWTEEEEIQSRITQLWWVEHEITAVHTNFEHALTELRRRMNTMATVHTHEVAIHSADKEAVTMVRIRRGMKVCPMSTKALLMAMTIKKIITGPKTPRETMPKTAHMATSHADYNRA